MITDFQNDSRNNPVDCDCTVILDSKGAYFEYRLSPSDHSKRIYGPLRVYPNYKDNVIVIRGEDGVSITVDLNCDQPIRLNGVYLNEIESISNALSVASLVVGDEDFLLELSVWDKVPGNSKEIDYFASGQPEQIRFFKNGALVVTQDFTEDGSSQIIEVVAS